jgi:hypothetical protein
MCVNIKNSTVMSRPFRVVVRRLRLQRSVRLHRLQIPIPRPRPLRRRIGLLLGKVRLDLREINGKRIVWNPAPTRTAHLRNHRVIHHIGHEAHVLAVFDAADMQGRRSDLGALGAGLEQFGSRQIGWLGKRHFRQHGPPQGAFGIARIAAHGQVGAVGKRIDDNLVGELFDRAVALDLVAQVENENV